MPGWLKRTVVVAGSRVHGGLGGRALDVEPALERVVAPDQPPSASAGSVTSAPSKIARPGAATGSVVGHPGGQGDGSGPAGREVGGIDGNRRRLVARRDPEALASSRQDVVLEQLVLLEERGVDGVGPSVDVSVQVYSSSQPSGTVTLNAYRCRRA